MSSDMCSNPRPCNCEICKPFGPEPEAAPPALMAPPQPAVASSRYSVETEWAVYYAHKRAARASDRLRAQRKRHAQRLAALQAKLEEVQARLDRAMEIVQYVAVGDHIRDWGADARVTILERINKQAQTLVAQEKVRKQA